MDTRSRLAIFAIMEMNHVVMYKLETRWDLVWLVIGCLGLQLIMSVSVKDRTVTTRDVRVYVI